MQSSSETNCLPFESRSGQKVKLKAGPSWHLAQTKDALVCELNLRKIDHFLIIPILKQGKLSQISK
jgi:hypothetical protein